MTNFTIGRWLLVALAIVGLALAAPLVSAHGTDDTDTTAADAPPSDGTAADWAAWMETQMTDHMGTGAVEWMESQVGVTVDEMAEAMAAGGYHDGVADEGDGPDVGAGAGPGYGGGMFGQGHC